MFSGVYKALLHQSGFSKAGTMQGLTNADGSVKTECGIHVAGDDEESGLSNIRK